MNLKDLSKLINPKEIKKIKRKVAKMNTKEAQEELKKALGQANQIINDVAEDEENKND